jgi:hypothetical protein
MIEDLDDVLGRQDVKVIPGQAASGPQARGQMMPRPRP